MIAKVRLPFPVDPHVEEVLPAHDVASMTEQFHMEVIGAWWQWDPRHLYLTGKGQPTAGVGPLGQDARNVRQDAGGFVFLAGLLGCRVLETQKNRFGGCGHIFFLHMGKRGFKTVAKVSAA